AAQSRRSRPAHGVDSRRLSVARRPPESGDGGADRAVARRVHRGREDARGIRAPGAAQPGAGDADVVLPRFALRLPPARVRRLARHSGPGRLSQVVVARRTMKRTTRLLGYVVVLWLGATANFLLPRLLPGD